MLRALLFIFGVLAVLTFIFYLLGIYSIGPTE
jgi:hypothetical protein